MIKYGGLFFFTFAIFSCSTVDTASPVLFPGAGTAVVTSETLPENAGTVFPIPEIIAVNEEKPAVIVWYDGLPVTSPYDTNVPVPVIPPVQAPQHPVAVEKPAVQKPAVQKPAVPRAAPVVRSSKRILPEKIVTLYKRGKVSLPLRGTGWIFMGSVPSEGIAFEDKITHGTNDTFYFDAAAYGDFVLAFEQQHMSDSEILKQNIVLHLRDKKDEPLPSISAATETGDELPAQSLKELVRTGHYKKALETYEEHDVLLELLQEGVEKRNTSALVFFYNRVAGDKDAAAFFVDSRFLDLSVKAGKIFIKRGFTKEGVHLLEICLPFYEGKSDYDALLFILGTVYQSEKVVRNEKKAVFYYKKLLDNFPASIYWDTAHKEYMFLMRRYIDVR